jgi:hypothetical protein
MERREQGGQENLRTSDQTDLMANPGEQTLSPRVRLIWLLAAQLVLTSLLAPGDGGHWLAHTFFNLGVYDLAACLVLYLAARLRKDSGPGISMLAALMVAVGSVVVVVAGTYARGFLRLF